MVPFKLSYINVLYFIITGLQSLAHRMTWCENIHNETMQLT